MSREKPEIGDIWIYENHLYHISKIDDIEDGFGFKHHTACVCVTKNDERVSSGWYMMTAFLKSGVYLGKAKAKISDLFEVNNE